jgi:competence protein ComEC
MWLFIPVITAAFASGIFVEQVFGGFSAYPTGALMIFATGVIWWCRSRPPLMLLASALLSFTAGGLRSEEQASRGVPFVVEGEQLIEVQLQSSCRPATRECSASAVQRQRYTPQNSWIDHRLRLRLILRNLDRLPLLGDRLLVRARVLSYERGLHEFAFDAKAWAATREVSAIAIVDEPVVWLDEAERADGRTASAPTHVEQTVFRAIDYGRARFERVIIATLGESDEAGVLLAMTTGTKSLLSDDFRRDFAAAGIAHVLAVSGMHLGLISMVFYLGLWRLIALLPLVVQRVPAQQIAAGVTIVFIFGYVTFTGFPISAVRAGLMAFFVLVPRALGRPGSGLHSLSMAVFILLFSNPRWLGDLGFQLSVSATLSLILLRMPRPLAASGFFLKRVLAWLWNASSASIVVSTVTAVATFPPLLWHFGTIPASSQLGNLLLVPPLALIALPGTILGVLLELLVGTDLELISMAGRIVALTGDWIQWWEPWFCAEIYWGRPSLVGIIGWFLIACVSPWIFRLRPGRLLAILLVPLILIGHDLPPRLVPSGDLEFHAIPVGQGDATLIVFPEGTTMLIDAGGSGFGENRTGLRLVLPYLRGLGIGRVDILVNSHGDADHIGGLLPLMAEVRPDTVWVGEPDPEKRMEALLYKASLNRGSRYLQPHRVSRRALIDGVVIDVLPGGTGFGSNDSGLVMRICWKSVCGLFTGDIEQPREQYLIEQGALLHAQYLKVGHHGSRTSTSRAFLDRVAPSVAILHLADGNRFGFPHDEVMRRLTRRNIRLERTDQGTVIRHHTDGEHLWLKRYGLPVTRGTFFRLLAQRDAF